MEANLIVLELFSKERSIMMLALSVRRSHPFDLVNFENLILLTSVILKLAFDLIHLAILIFYMEALNIHDAFPR